MRTRLFTYSASITLVLLVSTSRPAHATDASFLSGDVFVAVSNGQVQWRHRDGTLNRTLTTGLGGYTTGMAFDTNHNLYVTDFTGQQLTRFDSTGQLLGNFGSGYNNAPESILFDPTGNAYVGQAEGTKDILKFGPTGNFLARFDVGTEDRGSDWLDLGPDHCTMYYTSEGAAIKRFNVCTNTQLSDLTTGLHGAAYALRQLPGGGFLVADSVDIHLLDASGNTVRTYDQPGEDCWFALNLDPDGTTFWSADFCTSNVYRFDIQHGFLVSPSKFNTGTGAFTVFGLVVFGELTVSAPVDLLDPVKSLLTPEGNLLQPDSVLSLDTLAAQGIVRQGVGADGVAKLVLRYNAPSPGLLYLFFSDQAGNQLPDEDEIGSISDLAGTHDGDLISLRTFATTRGDKAFVVYTAPKHFVRPANDHPGDANSPERQVFVKTIFLPDAGDIIDAAPFPIKVLRPPVLLVHGIWSCDHSWDDFGGLKPDAPDPRFFVEAADYSNLSVDGTDCLASEGFQIDAARLSVELNRLIDDYKDNQHGKGVAAIQADVVTHSMGGPVVRTMAVADLFREHFLHNSGHPSFGKGPIRRLITIAGVHLGTQMANFLLDNACARDKLNTHGSPTENGAVADLAEGSSALQAIAGHTTPFGVHTIIGLATDGQKADVLHSSQLGKLNWLVPAGCGPGTLSSVDLIHEQTDLDGSSNDIMVTRKSQSGGRASPVTLVSGVTHSDPFDTPQELDDSSGNPQRVITLLDDADDTHFVPLP